MINNISFPYPVLGRSDDYVDREFQVIFNFKESDLEVTEKIRIEYEFILSEESINEQLKAGKARYGFEISCSGTSIKEVEFVDDKGILELNPTKYFRKVIFQPRIFVVDCIENYHSESFNDEFKGLSFKYEPGDVLAITDEESIYVDFSYLKFVDAIKVKRMEELQPWVYKFKLDEESIVIAMGDKFHKFWTKFRDQKDRAPILIMSVYKDCMLAALEAIISGDEDDYPWAGGLTEMLNEKGLQLPEIFDFIEVNEIAQKLMSQDGVEKVDNL